MRRATLPVRAPLVVHIHAIVKPLMSTTSRIRNGTSNLALGFSSALSYHFVLLSGRCNSAFLNSLGLLDKISNPVVLVERADDKLYKQSTDRMSQVASSPRTKGLQQMWCLIGAAWNVSAVATMKFNLEDLAEQGGEKCRLRLRATPRPVARDTAETKIPT
ncbi:hypothetical protein KC333_g27 [Hortaea werneckii]|nr:hypothetical protein KC333_g27 [Hortaea werneckii]